MGKSICTVEECDRAMRALGYCELHYHRLRRTGALTVKPRHRRGACSVEGCAKQEEKDTLCAMHSSRMKRTGTLEGIRPWRGGVCSIDGCDREHDSRGLCKLHARRLRHNGDPMVVRHGKPGSGPAHPNWAGDDVSYEGLHGRIRRVRGSASLHQCVDCGMEAYDWSYDHQSAEELHSPDGIYCLDINHYEPRCRGCHIAFDSVRLH